LTRSRVCAALALLLLIVWPTYDYAYEESYITLAMGIGLFAPPFGVGYYAACAIWRVDPAEGIEPIWAYLLALLVGLVIVAAFPMDLDRVPIRNANGGDR
jgi:TRAP-type C4-dicarboxylate transport system permease large subunit